MKKQILYWLAFGVLLVIGCQKETSFEGSSTPSDGSLQADGTGDCLPKTVNGAYIANTALVSATNTITVQVNVNRAGSYVITTDTVNGYYFRTSGIFTSTGSTNVTLRGNGTPFSAGVNNFIVSYDSTQCDIAVTVLPAGTGSAVFTLAGAPGNCTGATIQGTYATGVALNPATNIVAITTNVTTIGTYNISTTYQGMTFSASGAFTTTGLNTVSLTGAGTPTTGGANTVPLTAGSSTCNFVVNVTAPAAGTLTCASLVVQGTYTAGTAVTAANSIQIPVNFTSTGAYSIETNTVDGLKFFLTGNATATGVQTLTVPAQGTPGTSGTKSFTLSLNGSTTGNCTFTVNVLPGTGGTANGTLNCSSITVQGTYTAGTAVTAANTIQVQVNFTSTGAYTISSNTVDGLNFTIAGNASATGTQTITVPAVGTPTPAGTKNFTLSLNGSSTGTCTFSVTVAPSGGGAAIGTLGGAPNACAPITVNGYYYIGTTLTGTNTVQVQLNVATAGTYTINSNTVDNFSFSGSGNVATGIQNVTLAGSGSPTNSGPQTFTVTFGTSTCTFVVNVLSSDYFPRTTGSNWSYENDDDALDSLYRYVIPQTHSAIGNTYNIFMAKDGTAPDPDSSGYYRMNSGIYYEWIDMAGLIGFDPPPQWMEYIMLKDNVAVGASWNSPGFTGTFSGGSPYTLRFLFTIDQKNVPVTVTTSLGTVTYQNVIVVKEEFEQFVGGVWVNVTSAVGKGYSYYAKGIGLIKYEAFDGAGAQQFLQELRRYSVQ